MHTLSDGGVILVSFHVIGRFIRGSEREAHRSRLNNVEMLVTALPGGAPNTMGSVGCGYIVPNAPAARHRVDESVTEGPPINLAGQWNE